MRFPSPALFPLVALVAHLAGSLAAPLAAQGPFLETPNLYLKIEKKALPPGSEVFGSFGNEEPGVPFAGRVDSDGILCLEIPAHWRFLRDLPIHVFFHRPGSTQDALPQLWGASKILDSRLPFMILTLTKKKAVSLGKGTLLDARGKPVPGARVSLYFPSTVHFSFWRDPTNPPLSPTDFSREHLRPLLGPRSTDPKGQVRLWTTRAPNKNEYAVVCFSKRGVLAGVGFNWNVDPSRPQVLRLPQPRPVRYRLRLPKGMPRTGIHFGMRPLMFSDRDRETSMVGFLDLRPTGLQWEETRDGLSCALSFDPMIPWSYQVFIRDGSRRTVAWKAFSFEEKNDTPIDMEEKWDIGIPTQVRVQDKEGRPIPSPLLSWHRSRGGPPSYTQALGPKGEGRVLRLFPRDTCAVWARGYRMAKTTPKGNKISFTLKPAPRQVFRIAPELLKIAKGWRLSLEFEVKKVGFHMVFPPDEVLAGWECPVDQEGKAVTQISWPGPVRPVLHMERIRAKQGEEPIHFWGFTKSSFRRLDLPKDPILLEGSSWGYEQLRKILR